MSCKQSDIFEYSIKPTVDDILNGYNGTVFAYGQTGAGKSYTVATLSLLLCVVAPGRYGCLGRWTVCLRHAVAWK